MKQSSAAPAAGALLRLLRGGCELEIVADGASLGGGADAVIEPIWTEWAHARYNIQRLRSGSTQCTAQQASRFEFRYLGPNAMPSRNPI